MKKPLPTVASQWHPWPLGAKIQMHVKENLNLRSLRGPSPTRNKEQVALLSLFFILLLISTFEYSWSLGTLLSLVH